MNETWTEYGVQFPEGTLGAHDRDHAENINAMNGNEGAVVGRTVTASDWLPVDTDSAP